MAKIITREPKAGSDVVRVKPMGVKLKKRPTRAVMAKLNPMEKVNLSITSRASSLGNNVSVRQYPGKKATRTKANMYLRYDNGVPVSGKNRIEANERIDVHMMTQNHLLFLGDRKLMKFSLWCVGSSRDTSPFR